VSVAISDANGRDVAIETTDKGDNTFDVEFQPQVAGEVIARVYFADVEIPRSPFHIKIRPHINIDAVIVEGLEKSKCLVFPCASVPMWVPGYRKRPTVCLHVVKATEGSIKPLTVANGLIRY
jgi:Filamin/ABP280 repeat